MPRGLTILHVVVDGELAGGQLVAHRLIRGAEERGHASLVVSPTRGAFTSQLERDGISVHVVDLARVTSVGGGRDLRRLVRRAGVDVVHTHGMLASNTLSRVAGRAAGAAVVWHAHGAPYYPPGRARAYAFADALTARLCARVIAVSHATARALAAAGVPGRLIEVVHNGYDPPAGDPRPMDGSRTIACVGRIEPAKGQLDLVRALAHVPGANALFVGRDVDGHAAEVEREAHTVGVADRVSFAGVREDVLDVLAHARVLALPSRAEGFPIAPLEAMAVSRPVVATRVGGTPELVADGETGLLVPPGDVEALAAALRRVLEDDELARRLGAGGYRRLRERFSEAAMVDRVAAIWERSAR